MEEERISLYIDKKKGGESIEIEQVIVSEFTLHIFISDIGREEEGGDDVRIVHSK